MEKRKLKQAQALYLCSFLSHLVNLSRCILQEVSDHRPIFAHFRFEIFFPAVYIGRGRF